MSAQVLELLSFLCLEPDMKMLLGPQTRCHGAAQDPFGLRSQPRAGCDTAPATCPLPDWLQEGWGCRQGAPALVLGLRWGLPILVACFWAVFSEQQQLKGQTAPRLHANWCHLIVVALLAAAGSSCAMLWGLLDLCFCWE